MEFSQESRQINSIISYSQQTIFLEDEQINSPCFISNTQRIKLQNTTITTLEKEVIKKLIAHHKINLLIIGTGDKQCFLPAKEKIKIQSLGVGVETMTNQKACHCYNLLLSDGRFVGLLLL